MEALLSWVRETEALANEESETLDEDGRLLHQLRLSQDLQSRLMSRSGDVAQVASDVQVFVSERAQDLAPQQSRCLLGQLQQLHRAFHSATGQARARAAAQREHEEEWRHQKERRADVEVKLKEKQMAADRSHLRCRGNGFLTPFLSSPCAYLCVMGGNF
ncbi:microtubule-actin cross-linking factor 1, isoforms 1/2/3/5-like [Hippocampus comes]|uniref:microtubule-actin cross-linking factor 1, isoforms 1/2/3/5-like n=1 Tax=Hippocampus comes TaxID=109280 RepID=UPI00094F015C|nr:PREDICTED: microtubule-actin cross-linking factor 1, isoforms 1/2/3/5-like [Hippocampus comes]